VNDIVEQKALVLERFKVNYCCNNNRLCDLAMIHTKDYKTHNMFDLLDNLVPNGIKFWSSPGRRYYAGSFYKIFQADFTVFIF